MIDLVNFTNCIISSRNLEYGGRAGEKKGIIFDNSFWFLKFPKTTSGMRDVNITYTTSPLSEFIGCQIFRILGYDVQDTLLGICFDGTYNKVVCACKDFILNEKEEKLIPYTSLRNDADPAVMGNNSSRNQSASNIKEIIYQLENNTALKSIPGCKERFWDVAVIDMLINNNDRNEDNWGVIKNKTRNEYRLAPIYDCGNCFYGKASEDIILKIVCDEERLVGSAINGITAYDGPNDIRLSNNDLLKLDNKDLKKALKRVVEKVIKKQYEIIDFISSIPEEFEGINIISKVRKEYYIETFRIRLEKQILAYVESKKNKLLIMIKMYGIFRAFSYFRSKSIFSSS